MQASLEAALPKSSEIVKIPGDTVPRFSDPISRDDDRAPVTIRPPLDDRGRGKYVSNNAHPMCTGKSAQSRCNSMADRKVSIVGATGGKLDGITVVVVPRQSLARNSLQEWMEELIEGEVWCYLTHEYDQLSQLFRSGNGVCIISHSNN